MNKNILGMIGLARRAGKLGIGADKCSKSIKSGNACLVIIASDASCNTKKSIINSCSHYGVTYETTATKEELGRYAGIGEASVVSVNDDNLAKAILDRLNQSLRENEKG